MYTSLSKRLLSFLLTGVMVLGLLSVAVPPKAEAATDYTALKATLEALPYPVGSVISGLGTDVNGIWLIVSTNNRDGTTGYVMNSAAPESGNPAYPDDHRHGGTSYHPEAGITYVGYAVQYADIGDANKNLFRGQNRGNYTRIRGAVNNCTFQTMDDRYWNFEDIPDQSGWAALRLRPGENSNRFTITSSGSRTHTVLKNGTSNYYLNSNSWTFRVYRGTNITVERQFYFCRVSEGLFNMCEVLREAANYIVNDPTGRFDPTDYETFLREVNEALPLYNQHRDAWFSDLSQKETVFATATQQLREAMAKISVGDPYTVVLDYGKTIQADVSKIGASFDAGVNTRVSYVGATLEGSHGAVTATKPAELLLTAKNCSAQTDDSTFVMATSAVLRFTPKTIMQGATTLYGVYRVSPVSNPSYTLYYITKAVHFLPAPAVYYETDLGANIYSVDRSDSLFIPFSDSDTTEWGSPANIINYSKSGGILRGTVNGPDPHIQMTVPSCTFDYTIKPRDVVKVRIKSPSTIGAELQVFFMTETNERPTTGIETKIAPYTPNGQWQIITLDIEAAVIGKTVKGIRIDPISAYKASAAFEIDWVYIGQPDEFNTPILVDFGTGDTTEWGEGSHNATVTKENGVLKGRVTGIDPYVRMSVASSTLGHIITDTDVVKVRIKSDPCIGNRLQIFFMTDSNATPTGGVSTVLAEYTPNGEWQTITLRLLDGLVGKQITGLRLDPSGGDNTYEGFQSEGAYECDWIYVGPDVDFDMGDAFTLTTTSAVNQWQVSGSSNTVEAQTKLWDNTVPYGYDPSYLNDTKLSNHSAVHVIGSGIPILTYKTDENGYVLDEAGNTISIIDYASAKAYTEASFEFTGTGFDIISRTGPDQADLRAYICDRDGNVKRTVSVFCKGENDLYQIPIISVKDLEYGTYTVHIFVNSPYENPEYSFLDRGGMFYFDAVRIYGTINVHGDTEEARMAYNAYLHHGEADPTFKELRDILIEAGNFTAGSSIDGVVYLDATPKEGTDFDSEGGRLEMEVAEYKAIGPNNEVYLGAGNAIAFKLEAEGALPASIDIGARNIDGVPASMIINISTTPPETVPGGDPRILSGCTALYYPLEIPSSAWQAYDESPNKQYVYVTIYNSGTSGILSITDIKYAYDVPATAATEKPRKLRFIVDREMMDQFAGPCEHKWDAGVETLQPTCTQNGERTYTCESCGETRTEQVERLGHSYNKGEITTAPTCTAEGVKTFTCGICGDAYTEAISALGHSYEAVVTHATCTEPGFTTYTCSACGEAYVDDHIGAPGHSYNTAATPPTCIERGYTTYACSRCNYSFTADTVPATGHSFADGSCSVCGTKDPNNILVNPFVDVKESDYFYDPVLWAVHEGITTGTSATTFSPNAPCTRGQVVTFLWRAAGSPEPTTTEKPFSDIQEKDYFYKAVLWAVEEGITTGTGKGKFSPEDTCTRGQVATFLWRAQGKPAPTSSVNPFNDVNSDAYYYSAILWAVEKGVTNGTGKGRFSPDDSCTRGQIVTFLYRALAK